METEDERVASIAALLMRTVNAPEGEIWRVSRVIARMNLVVSPLDLVEPEDADVLIKALKAYKPWDSSDESTVLYYIAQLQKVAANKEKALGKM